MGQIAGRCKTLCYFMFQGRCSKHAALLYMNGALKKQSCVASENRTSQNLNYPKIRIGVKVISLPLTSVAMIP